MVDTQLYDQRFLSYRPTFIQMRSFWKFRTQENDICVVKSRPNSRIEFELFELFEFELFEF